MKPFSNTVILIEFLNGGKNCFAVPSQENPVDAYHRILKIEELQKSEIKRWFSFDKSLYSPEQYEKYWDTENGEIDKIKIISDQKIDNVRQQRSRLFPLMDMEFMKSMEEDCVECKEHVVMVKNYMRDLPGLLENHFKKINDFDKISRFNPYNNIFNLTVVENGSGYEKPPKIKIIKPNGNWPGFPLKAVASITEEGILDEVAVIQIGSGYRQAPEVKASKPEDPDGNLPIIIASPPENDIIENVTWKETRQSSEDYLKSVKRLLNMEEEE